MGREKFLERVWEWKAQSGGAIIEQLQRLGASCDWSRERFTLDDGLSRAVVKVFVELYKEGLIYKDKRLVNWDPKLQTAISDLEVVQVETKGHLWHFKYPVVDDDGRETGEFIVVATTRPETMLGDTGGRGSSEGRSAIYTCMAKRCGCRSSARLNPNHRRRIFRPGKGHRRGEDHPRA